MFNYETPPVVRFSEPVVSSETETANQETIRTLDQLVDEVDDFMSDQMATESNTTNNSRAKNWCYTLNNYTTEQVEHYTGLFTTRDDVLYHVFGREIGDSGTPHLQGLICFNRRIRFTELMTILIGSPHVEITRRLQASSDYCKKDEDYVETGTLPAGPGARSDLEHFMNAVKGGEYSEEVLRERFPVICARYPVFVKQYIQDKRPVRDVPAHPLRLWQQHLYDILVHEPNDREIIFVVDLIGNSGKTWFGKYYCWLHDNAQVLNPGKKADLAYALRDDLRVVFLDVARSKQGEFVQYDFLEEVKNGYIFSPKYTSFFKTYGSLHVVVTTNEFPDMTKLSADRYKIIDVASFNDTIQV